MRRLSAPALLFSVMMIAPAFGYTDEQVSACTPDVMLGGQASEAHPR